MQDHAKTILRMPKNKNVIRANKVAVMNNLLMGQIT